MTAKPITNRKPIVIERREADFDRACASAIIDALSQWGIDVDGHIKGVAGSDRSTDSMRIEWTGYAALTGMDGLSHVYEFETWIERNND